MAQYELNFRDYIRVFRKRRLIIVITFISCLVSTGIYLNLQIPIYRAEALVKLEGRQTVFGVLAEQLIWKEAQPLETETEMIRSRLIAEEVSGRLGLVKETKTIEEKEEIINSIQNSISAEIIQDTNLVKIVALSTDPKKARDLANSAAEVYTEVNLSQKLRQVRKMRNFLEEQMADFETKLIASEEKLRAFKKEESVAGLAVPLQKKLLDLQTELSELQSRATEKHPDVARLKEQIEDLDQQLQVLPNSELTFARLDREVKYNEKLYAELREKLDEVKMSEQEKVSDVIIVSAATEPNYPIAPNKTIGFGVGSISGILLGFILAFVIENLDTSIGTIEDVERILQLPVLAIIPSVGVQDKEDLLSKQEKKLKNLKFSKKEHRKRAVNLSSTCLTVQYFPHLPFAESFRILRTNLKLSPQRKTLIFTSTGPREGKTTVIVSFALILAQMGIKVILIDTDLRRPVIAKVLGIKREPGLSDVISGTAKLNDALRTLPDILIGGIDLDEALKTPGLDNITILPAGHIPLNPAGMLGSPQMGNIIDQLKSSYDVVLFDSPPSLTISDAIIMAPKLDGVVLVYEMGRTARAALLRSKVQLQSAGANVLGIVLNHISSDSYSSYYPYHYRYKYYYNEPPPGEGASEREKPKE